MQGWAQGQSSDLSLFHPFGAPQAELCPPRGPSPCQTGCSFPDYSENCSDHSGNLKSPIPVIQTAFIPFLRDLEGYSEKWVTSQKTINESESDPVQRTAKKFWAQRSLAKWVFVPHSGTSSCSQIRHWIGGQHCLPSFTDISKYIHPKHLSTLEYKRLKRKQIINWKLIPTLY